MVPENYWLGYDTIIVNGTSIHMCDMTYAVLIYYIKSVNFHPCGGGCIPHPPWGHPFSLLGSLIKPSLISVKKSAPFSASPFPRNYLRFGNSPTPELYMLRHWPGLKDKVPT